MDDAAADQVNDGVPLEVLERRLTSRAADIAAAEAEWMASLAEYDARRGWAEWGCLGPAHWLSWKCGLSPSAARERVRVATALVELRLVRAGFAAGRLSYSKVQALTRVANEFNEADLVELALNATGSQLARICAGYRSSATTDEAAADVFVSRLFGTRCHHDGSTTIAIRIPDGAAAQVIDHVEKLATAIIDDAVAASAGSEVTGTCAPASLTRRDAIAERNGIAAVRSDAAVALLIGEAEAGEPTPADVTMIIDADQHADSQNTVACAQVSEHVDYLVGETAIADTVAHRLLCDPRITALVGSADAGPLAVGRSTRVISRRLRRALARRDGGTCCFPGCHASKRLHAHHITHWVDGGPTELDNLASLCHFHHHLVHEGGWSLDHDRNFRRPDNTLVEPTPEHLRAGVATPIEPLDWPGAHNEQPWAQSPLEPPNLSPFDLPWTTTVIHHNESLRRQAAESASVGLEGTDQPT